MSKTTNLSNCVVYSTTSQRLFRCPACKGRVMQLSDSFFFECVEDMKGHPQSWGCGWLGFAERLPQTKLDESSLAVIERSAGDEPL